MAMPCLNASIVNVDDLCSDSIWKTLYTFLLPQVKNWVYSAGIRSWRGQENDIAWDIVQVALRRTFEYARRLQSEGTAIYSLNSLSVTIARNYLHDLCRRDARLVRFPQDTVESNETISLELLIDPEETASERLYQEWLLTWIAHQVATFPSKLRTALLIDIANRMHFGSEPTPLQRAFFTLGIRLQDYQRPLSTDPTERSRHASLLSLAYRRIKKAFASYNQSPHR